MPTNPQPDDWYDAGCARDCSEQHTYEWGRCALAPESAKPTPMIGILRVEDSEDRDCLAKDIVTRSIPLSAWDGLITVAKWVSRGKSFALDADPEIAPCYPDASARRALGALHDAGLLNAAAAPAQAGPDDTDLSEADVDRMMAAGTPVQIVTAPPDTHSAESVCKFDEGCHRVVACDPGCAVAAAELHRRMTAPADRAGCPDPIECSHEAALGQARETNRRLNLRAQQLESELAACRRAVAQWEVSERGTYIPLASLRTIGNAGGVDILGSVRHLKHFERVEQAEAAIERVLEFAASLDKIGRQLAGPDAVHPVAAHIRHLLAVQPDDGPSRVADEAQQPGPDRCSGCRYVPCGQCGPEASGGAQQECSCDPAPYRENDGTYSHWAGCPVADAQQRAAEMQATPCGPAPDACDAEAGEPCANHEREQAHAEGEHCFCGPECDEAQQPETQTVRPARGDQFEAWLKEQRAEFEYGDSVWPIIDWLLDRYRLHADTGTPLDQHACEGQNCDCPQAEQPAAVSQPGKEG